MHRSLLAGCSSMPRQHAHSAVPCVCVRQHMHSAHCKAQVPLAFLLLEKAAGEDPRIVCIALLPLSVQTVKGQGTAGLLDGFHQLLPLRSPSGIASHSSFVQTF